MICFLPPYLWNELRCATLASQAHYPRKEKLTKSRGRTQITRPTSRVVYKRTSFLQNYSVEGGFSVMGNQERQTY